MPRMTSSTTAAGTMTAMAVSVPSVPKSVLRTEWRKADMIGFWSRFLLMQCVICFLTVALSHCRTVTRFWGLLQMYFWLKLSRKVTKKMQFITKPCVKQCRLTGTFRARRMLQIFIFTGVQQSERIYRMLITSYFLSFVSFWAGK